MSKDIKIFLAFFLTCLIFITVYFFFVFRTHQSRVHLVTNKAETKGKIVLPLDPVIVSKSRFVEKNKSVTLDSLPDPVPYESPELKEFKNHIADLRTKKDFDGLDNLADKLRSEKTRTENGSWQLAYLYWYLSKCEPESDTNYTDLIEFFKEWEAKKESSITARVALANSLVNYAWFQRGSEWSNTVSPEGWKLYNQLLDQAQQVLTDAQTLSTKCPQWWSVAQTIALGQGWKRKEYDDIYNQAIIIQPDYDPFYYKKAIYLLPRWYGLPTESEKFAATLRDGDKEKGYQKYAMIVWHLGDLHRNIFRETSFSWESTKKGFEDLTLTYPSSTLLNAYCRLAYEAGDYTTSAALFAEIQEKMDLDTWHSKDFFLQVRKWVFLNRK